MHISIHDQTPQIKGSIQALNRHLNGDLTPVMSAIGALLENSTRKRFETKRDPEGISWAHLRATTQLSKTNADDRKAWYAGQKVLGQLKPRGGILVDRGTLLKSITHHATSQSVAIGTDRLYGKYHQTGTRTMPARPFLGVSKEDERDILRVLNDFIDKVFK